MSNVSSQLQTRSRETLVDFHQGQRIKLRITTEVGPGNKLAFSLDRPLPAEEGRERFVYNDMLLNKQVVVKSPELALCGTPRVRNFLGNFVYIPDLKIVRFSLVKVNFEHGRTIGPSLIKHTFTRACEIAFDVQEDEGILLDGRIFSK